MVTIEKSKDGQVMITVSSVYCLHEVGPEIARYQEREKTTAEVKAQKIAEIQKRIDALAAEKTEWEQVVPVAVEAPVEIAEKEDA